MSVTAGSRASVCSGPSPFSSALMLSTAARAPAVPSSFPLAWTAAATREGVTGPASDMMDSRTDSSSRGVQRGCGPARFPGARAGSPARLRWPQRRMRAHQRSSLPRSRTAGGEPPDAALPAGFQQAPEFRRSGGTPDLRHDPVQGQPYGFGDQGSVQRGPGPSPDHQGGFHWGKLLQQPGRWPRPRAAGRARRSTILSQSQAKVRKASRPRPMSSDHKLVAAPGCVENPGHGRRHPRPAAGPGCRARTGRRIRRPWAGPRRSWRGSMLPLASARSGQRSPAASSAARASSSPPPQGSPSTRRTRAPSRGRRLGNPHGRRRGAGAAAAAGDPQNEPAGLRRAGAAQVFCQP